ncbi:hypothetical protein PBCVAN69C_458R [Paramecium bursaria Chlorella virus AN69C]|uniref:Uncharacterized protein n=2 Tax=Chlorovirus TaxID=181083 RepID=Q98454_PBCV1|nr:hypothetical protein PBCV1_A402R [Paramecium bursaria Chlorella virus 1]AAC96770.1 hypothetical protein [Paramecium bursaria Chlorella virus 1]AGE48504.1 hypothetical protein PBCVAN69C_458R [Paramecium bursaria Chlorella virus AN69C]AGE53914.1 hypothetical protein PBCVIL3A_453R [Paramecium bursaria Chlorella virus IL3A]AGE57343.1 hypothetical protein PBCVNEJV4_457R [Paramecium bursaria Chlorella virus NE-JV-4]
MQHQKVILAIITDTRPDMTLQCCVSILHLQAQLIQTQNGFQADMRFYNNINEAISDLYRSKEFTGIFIIKYSAGVPGPFALKAWASKHDVVVGIHPMQSIDWERVKEKITTTTEDISHTGIVYNLKLNGMPDAEGFGTAKEIKALDVMFVKRTAIDYIAKNNPGSVSEDGMHSSIFLEGVYDGKYMTGVERFVKLYGKPIYADANLQCSKSACQDYVGIVGNRSQLR